MPWGAMCAGAGDWKLEPASEPYCETVSMEVAFVCGRGWGEAVEKTVVTEGIGLGTYSWWWRASCWRIVFLLRHLVLCEVFRERWRFQVADSTKKVWCGVESSLFRSPSSFVECGCGVRFVGIRKGNPKVIRSRVMEVERKEADAKEGAERKSSQAMTATRGNAKPLDDCSRSYGSC